MGMISDLGLNNNMTIEQVSEQLFLVRRKIITRQNSADAQKRKVAEEQLAIISSLQNAINKMSPNFPNVNLIIETYGFFADNGKLNKDLQNAIEVAVTGNGDLAGRIADFLFSNRQNELRNEWVFWAAECGTINAFQICGLNLMDNAPDEALIWFDKADKAGVISVQNVYNWGVIFYRKKEFEQALIKFERASAEGHAMADLLIAEMYENGYGVAQDYRKALEYYSQANQRGAQKAQQCITRVTALLDQQSVSSSTVIVPVDNHMSNQLEIATNNGHPILIYKSDRKTVTSYFEKINIDKIKNLIKKRKPDVVVSDDSNLANDSEEKTISERVMKLPWKKISIGVVAILVILLMIKSIGGEKSFSGGISKENTRQLLDEEKAIIGTYSGYYYVEGGKRGVTLDIYEKNGLEASFSFYPLNSEDNFSSGQYLMAVEYNDGKYEFTATDWINQPQGFYTINLSGVFDNDMLYGLTENSYAFSVTQNHEGYVENVWLTDLRPVYQDEAVFVEEGTVGTANTGDSYMHYMYSRRPYSEIIYHLNGQYENLEGVWSICYSGKDDQSTNSFEIYADDTLVYSSDVITAGSLPSDVKVNIDYCNVLRIRFIDGVGVGEFGNVRLTNSEKIEVPTVLREVGPLPCWLTDTDYLTKDNVTIMASEIGVTNMGEEYSHYIFGTEGASIEYYLRGQYNNLTGTWAVCYNDRDIEYSSRFEIYADDELVYESPSITGEDMPVKVNVDIKNCQKLRLFFPEGNGAAEFSNIYLMNVERQYEERNITN